MPDLIDVLNSYAEEYRIPLYLHTPEYRRAVMNLETRWDEFRSSLTPEQTRKLDTLLSQEAEADRLSSKAAFQAALSIGIGLGRL